MGALLLERVLAGGGIVLLVAGATAALTAPNAIKRLVGLMIAGFGALAALAALQAPQGALVAAVAALLAQAVAGVAIVVRLQEGYATIETPEIDAADAESEARDPAP
jgi:hypothetical protein